MGKGVDVRAEDGGAPALRGGAFLERRGGSRLSPWLFAAAYFASAESGKLLSAPDQAYVSFWLPAGVYLAALLLAPRQRWPQYMLAALVANFAFDLQHGTPPLATLLFYCANTLQATLGAWSLRRLVAERPTLSTLRELSGLIALCAVGSTLFGAAIGAGTLVLFGLSHSFIASLAVWWGSCGMAIALVAPFLITWLQPALPGAYAPRHWRRWLEACVLVAGMLLVSWHVFTRDGGLLGAHKARLLPLLLWAGLRFGPRGATAANLLVALVSAFLTTHVPFGISSAELAGGQYVLTLQTFLAVASMVSLVPAIVLSERDRTVAQLRASEERFRQLNAAAFEGLCISERGVIVDANEQLLKMFDRERSEMVGHPILEFVAAESRTAVSTAVREGHEDVYEHCLLRKDGTSFYAEAQAKLVHDDGRTLRMTALRDITARRRAEQERNTAEQALSASEALLRQFIKHAPAAIAMLDTELRYLQTSDRWLSDYRLQGQDIIGKAHYEVFPKQPERWKEMHKRVLAGAIERSEEDPIRQADGTREWLQWEARPWRRAGGAIGGVLFFTQVITQRKQAEETRGRLEAQLRQSQKLEAIGTLAGGIAHDFNNILGAIISYTELTRLENARDPRIQRSLGEVLSASHRAAALVQQVLTFSRKQPQMRVSIDLAPVVAEALSLLRSTLPRTIELEARLDDDLPAVLADPTQVHQIVVNLCTNAAHAMRDGGTIAVQLQAHRQVAGALIHAPDLPPGDYLALRVRDSGHGMNEDTVQRMFEPFFTTKGPGEGSGLGLAVVHGIVRDHGGTISVESRLEQGTCVHVFLPSTNQPVAADERPPEPSRGSGERILFVDDEPVLCAATSALLSRLGFHPTALTSADDAWNTFNAHPNEFDLVITDLTMPRMTGIELARRMLGVRPGLPILLTSGFPSQLNEDALRELGVRGLLLKPVDHTTLLSGIQRALAG